MPASSASTLRFPDAGRPVTAERSRREPRAPRSVTYLAFLLTLAWFTGLVRLTRLPDCCCPCCGLGLAQQKRWTHLEKVLPSKQSGSKGRLHGVSLFCCYRSSISDLNVYFLSHTISSSNEVSLMLKGFRDFILRGNVIDLAVARLSPASSTPLSPTSSTRSSPPSSASPTSQPSPSASMVASSSTETSSTPPSLLP